MKYLIFILLIAGCTPSLNKHVNLHVNDHVKVKYGYYEGCKGYITEINEKGIWIYVTDCKGQTGKRFFTKEFVKKI